VAATTATITPTSKISVNSLGQCNGFTFSSFCLSLG
jgi:hypothetical protein